MEEFLTPIIPLRMNGSRWKEDEEELLLTAISLEYSLEAILKLTPGRSSKAILAKALSLGYASRTFKKEGITLFYEGVKRRARRTRTESQQSEALSEASEQDCIVHMNKLNKDIVSQTCQSDHTITEVHKLLTMALALLEAHNE